MKTAIILTVVALFGALQLLHDIAEAMPVRVPSTQQTLEVCNKAHNEINAESEVLCGQMQDQTGTQYGCDINGQNCFLKR